MTEPNDAWRLERVGRTRLVRSTALAALDGIAHGFSTRRWEDRARFDLGTADPADECVARRRRRFLDAVGLCGVEPVVLRQVHGDTVVRVRDMGVEAAPRADAVVALRDDRPRLAPSVRTADCVPILVADRRGRAVAAIHAGWRGTAAAVARRVVAALARLGVEPGDLHAALGPAIGPCCYEVDPDVLRAVARGTGAPESAISPIERGQKPHLDLRLANAVQLRTAGVPQRSIDSAPWCTACSRELFFSHRRDGTQAGRMMASIGWSVRRPRSP